MNRKIIWAGLAGAAALAAGVAIAQTPSTSNPDYNNTPSSSSATTTDQSSSSTTNNAVNPAPNDQSSSATSAGSYGENTAATTGTEYNRAGERG